MSWPNSPGQDRVAPQCFVAEPQQTRPIDDDLAGRQQRAVAVDREGRLAHPRGKARIGPSSVLRAAASS